MKPYTSMSHHYKRLGALICLAVISLPLTFGQADEKLLNVIRIKIHPEKHHEFMDLQKQLSEAQEAAGMRGRHVWQEVRGNTHTFHLVSRLESFASLDENSENPMGPDGWERWVARMRSCIKNREHLVVRALPGLEIPPKKAGSPKLLRLREITPAPGRVNEFAEWFEEKLYPAQRKAGVDGVSLLRTVLGTDPRVFHEAMHFESWGELDGPGWPSRLSDSDREDLWDGHPERVASVRLIMLRYVDELSFGSLD